MTRRLQLVIFVAVLTTAAIVLPRVTRPTDILDHGDVVGGGWTAEMSRAPIDVLFVGNSTLEFGVDPEAFERWTGRNTHSLWMPGSGGGWWYLVLDEVATRAAHVPKLVVICFNDETLTLTSKIMSQGDLDRVVRMLDEEDRRSGVADRLARAEHTPAVVLLNRYWPLVRVRDDVRRLAENAVLGYVGSIAGTTSEGVADAMARVFALERKDAEQIDTEAGATSFDSRIYDFERMKDRSFLPDLLESAKAHHIPLVFVRVPRKVTPSRLADLQRSAALRSYSEDLEVFLEEQGYPMLDFSELELDAARDFGAGDHLTESGRAVFLPALVKGLEPYLPPTSVVADG